MRIAHFSLKIYLKLSFLKFELNKGTQIFADNYLAKTVTKNPILVTVFTVKEPSSLKFRFFSNTFSIQYFTVGKSLKYYETI